MIDLAAGAASSSTEVIAWIVIPLFLFLLSSAAAGVTALVKFTGYMARTQAAQESVADTNKAISETLSSYMQRTDSTLLNHTTELAVHRSEIDRLERQQNGQGNYHGEGR